MFLVRTGKVLNTIKKSPSYPHQDNLGILNQRLLWVVNGRSAAIRALFIALVTRLWCLAQRLVLFLGAILY